MPAPNDAVLRPDTLGQRRVASAIEPTPTKLLGKAPLLSGVGGRREWVLYPKAYKG